MVIDTDLIRERIALNMQHSWDNHIMLAMLDEIVALRKRNAELEADRDMVTYIIMNTNPHPDEVRRVINEALIDVHRKLDGKSPMPPSGVPEQPVMPPSGDGAYTYPELLDKYFPGDTIDMDEKHEPTPLVDSDGNAAPS